MDICSFVLIDALAVWSYQMVGAGSTGQVAHAPRLGVVKELYKIVTQERHFEIIAEHYLFQLAIPYKQTTILY